MSKTYVPTGIPGVDEILHGGFLSDRTYLIVGSTGTGKTIMSLQWLLSRQAQGEKCLFITLAEDPLEVKRNLAGFNWDLEGIKILDMTPSGEAKDLKAGEYNVFDPSEVEQIPAWKTIVETVEKSKPRNIVIDSVTQLRYLSTNEYQFRKMIIRLVKFLNNSKCTTLLIFEPTELDKETSVALAVDGIIRLNRQVSGGRVIELRSLEVEKLRGSGYYSGYHPLRFTSDGIVVYPHRVRFTGKAKPGTELLPFGIPQLDELLQGGLESGTISLISGQTGVGKSTLGMQFLIRSIMGGKQAILFTFEESVESIIKRSNDLNMPIGTLLEEQHLKIVKINSADLYPDELLFMIRTAVETEKFNVVMIDSLRGYNIAMEQFGSLMAHLYNLTSYLSLSNVSTVLVNEVEHITGELRLTELGVSFLVDNALLLRYAEIEGRIIRVIGCLKKRLGSYQPDLRELVITHEGIRIGEKLSGLQGLLTGVPERLN
ncbi:MAG: ATPase domain-containing protein [Fidelibacterota bacterium]